MGSRESPKISLFFKFSLLGITGIAVLTAGILLLANPFHRWPIWGGALLLGVGFLITGYWWQQLLKGLFSRGNFPGEPPHWTGYLGFVMGSLLFWGVIGGVIFAIKKGDFHHLEAQLRPYHRELVIGGLVALFLFFYQFFGKVGEGVTAPRFWAGFKALPSTLWDLVHLFRALFSPKYLLLFLLFLLLSAGLFLGVGYLSKIVTHHYQPLLAGGKGGKGGLLLQYYGLSALLGGVWLWLQIGVLEVLGGIGALSLRRE
jgi:hypothetical protein